MIFCGDSPSYRSVQIELTDDQQEKMKLKYIGQSGGSEYTEQYSTCFLEGESE
jgi:hypothetical protein